MKRNFMTALNIGPEYAMCAQIALLLPGFCKERCKEPHEGRVAS